MKYLLWMLTSFSLLINSLIIILYFFPNMHGQFNYPMMIILGGIGFTLGLLCFMMSMIIQKEGVFTKAKELLITKEKYEEEMKNLNILKRKYLSLIEAQTAH